MSRIAADSSVFAAIADPTRRAILDLLREGEQTVNAMLAAVAANVRGSRASPGLGMVGLRRAQRSDHREMSTRIAPISETPQRIA